RQEQETDNERKANSGEDKPNAAPKRFEQYQKQKNSEKEILQTIPPNFNIYYKDKVKKYFEKTSN
ncbi:MAG: hypothetical protein HYZ42_06085, partial [Bacteroidetes bacterium]|nr:hypothetical protein [Bacteroidota bacterium]